MCFYRAMHLAKRVGKASAVFQTTTRQLTWTPRRGSSCGPSSIWPSRSSTSRRWTRRCRRDVRAIWFRLPKATLNRVAQNCVICVKQLRSMPLTTVPPVSFYLRQNCPRPVCSLTTTEITHNTTPTKTSILILAASKWDQCARGWAAKIIDPSAE